MRRNRKFSIDKYRNLSIYAYTFPHFTHTEAPENVLNKKFNSVYADMFAIFLERVGGKRN